MELMRFLLRRNDKIVNKIQNLRKNENFDVIDKIYLEINSQNNDFTEAIKNHYNY